MLTGVVTKLAYEHLKKLTGGKIDIWLFAWVPTNAESFRSSLESARKLGAKQILYWEADYIDNNKKGLKQNDDGSYDVYFGPKPPKGQENNWIQTVSGKGWNTILRLYGPLESFYDKTWKPGDPELVE